jgi:uncharacterized protein (DUF697 family)
MLKALKQARAVLGLLNPEELRQRAGREIHIGLVASTDSGYAKLEEFLVPPDQPQETRTEALTGVHRATDLSVPPTVELVLYESGLRPHPGAYALERGNPGQTLAGILHDHEDLALSLARHFPGFRKAVVDRTIQAVASENALFAIATALPDVVPNLIELPWAVGEFASDTIFLTVNQVRMAFLIAAACGDEVGFAQQKAAIAAIVAAAFGWRALARELAGKIPLGGGLIPKGAIAYAGTFVIGKALEHLRANRPFTAEQHRAAYDEAYQEGIEVAKALRKRT